MSTLLVDSIRCGYGDVEVVRGVSFDVSPGECVGIIGPNGHGKSTMVRAVSGLVHVQHGRIELEGKVISGASAHSIARLGVAHVPQGDMLFSDLTVEDNISAAVYGAGKWSRRTELLGEAYKQFPRLGFRKKQQAGTLSGGERRMLAIGRATVLEPKLLILDEPSLGLSPKVIEDVYDTIRALRESGVTLLIVEENPARLAGLAERMCLIDRGSIVESGTVDYMLGHTEVMGAYFGRSLGDSGGSPS